MDSLLPALAACSGIVYALAPLFQIRAMLAARSSAGLSLPFVLIGFVNSGIWLCYAIKLANPVMIVPNIAGLALLALLLLVALALRGSRTATTADANPSTRLPADRPAPALSPAAG